MKDEPPDLALEFDNDAGSPRKARRALSSMFTDPDDPIADAVVLTASEFVTNVVLHTDSPGILRAWDPKPDIPLRLEVEDHHPVLPSIPVDPAVGGHGLEIVGNVADAWGADRTSDGKVVWAEFNRPTD